MLEFGRFLNFWHLAAARERVCGGLGRKEPCAGRALLKLNYGTLAVVAVFAPIFLVHACGLPWTVPRIVGFAIAVPSFLLLVLARIQLGRAFSVQAKASVLVTSGLYSRIRNPIYVFGGLTIAGIIVW